MAVSMGSSAGIGVMTADEAHAVMVALRSRLLEVGLEELDIPGSYDASEEGSSSQIPDGPITTSTNLYSERMHFAFTDSLQSQHPLVISFRMVLGPFFSVSSSGGFATNPRYMAEIRISKGVDDDGSPLGATFISRLASASSNASSYALSNSSGSGDFVRYTGDSLTVFIGLDQVTNTAGKRSLVQIHVERIEGGEFSAIPAGVSGTSSVVPQVHYSNGGSVSSRSDLQARAGGVLGYYESGAAVVSPIFSHVPSGGIVPLKRVFTIPSLPGDQGTLPELDFSGVLRRYLVIKGGASAPYEPDTDWLYEWE